MKFNSFDNVSNLTAASLCLSLLVATVSRAEMREFKSAQGSVIKAELKKAKGQTIILQSDQGKELQVPLKSFSSEDQLVILKWMAEDPSALDHTFAVKATVKEIAGAKADQDANANRRPEMGRGRGWMETTSEKKAFEVEIASTTRAPLRDVSVDWCAFELDKVKSREDWRGAFEGLRRPGANDDKSKENGDRRVEDSDKGTLLVKRGTLALPEIDFSGKETFQTPAFRLDSSGSNASDKLLGVWLRFYRAETLIFEWKSPQCPKTEWPGGTHKALAKNATPTPEAGKPRPDAAVPAKPDSKPEPAAEAEDIMVKIFELNDTGK